MAVKDLKPANEETREVWNKAAAHFPQTIEGALRRLLRGRFRAQWPGGTVLSA